MQVMSRRIPDDFGIIGTQMTEGTMKRGLVLEGGAMRGLFTAGVLDALMAAGVRFDGIVGVSAGACFGCNYKSHQPGRVIRYNKKFARDPRYCSFSSLWKTGDLFNAEFCYRDLPERLDTFNRRVFDSDPTEFWCVTTDCATGRPVYHRCEKANAETFAWMRASASMPMVSRPVELDGALHLDGGLSDGIPLRWFESVGYGRNLVILTRPRDYRKRASWKHRLMWPFLRHMPAVYRAVLNRHESYNATLDYIAEREQAGGVLVIAPSEPLPIGRLCHDPDQMQRVYDIGLCEGRRNLVRLSSFFREPD